MLALDSIPSIGDAIDDASVPGLDTFVGRILDERGYTGEFRGPNVPTWKVGRVVHVLGSPPKTDALADTTSYRNYIIASDKCVNVRLGRSVEGLYNIVQSSSAMGVEVGADTGRISAITTRYNLRAPIEAGVAVERLSSTGESKMSAESATRQLGLVSESSTAYIWTGVSLNYLTCIMGNGEAALGLEWRAILPEVDRWTYENHLRQVSAHAEDLMSGRMVMLHLTRSEYEICGGIMKVLFASRPFETDFNGREILPQRVSWSPPRLALILNDQPTGVVLPAVPVLAGYDPQELGEVGPISVKTWDICNIHEGQRQEAQ
ncbi:hypothetical protein Pmar_PMAR006578 [Perkinsus marinus ATCC 50983]|uniref:Uncharacterized protein n=1 Tax=Perkinsus marinus (strain ATCC 50983 / TXsc) TaxID=423536 RepID=C5LTU1_PERM5|nr:hypothetical protein Pmar_PMAR006578 [Perkinsus marinus ATCC 50983]EEQ99903.1 hypothetical protein Pmar_PMAR006578 [Perkinsus marinus ATCC 50983]|eukprot:XP_002767186.1 hypothetical protein Pmar_PMAR006578 [Perkinsus marinus ATCC 50983]